MAIVMLRHGLVPKGTTDAPLTAQGRQEATTAADHLKQFPVDHIYSSPEKRAVETAHIWSKAAGVPMSVHPELDSWDLGVYKGKHSENANAAVRSLIDNPNKPAPGNGESASKYWARLLPFVAPLIQDDQLHGVVNHSRGLKSVESYMVGKGEGMDKATWKTPLTEPGEALLVSRQGVQPVPSASGVSS
jgi:broad specificity phosphatase PhoE